MVIGGLSDFTQVSVKHKTASLQAQLETTVRVHQSLNATPVHYDEEPKDHEKVPPIPLKSIEVYLHQQMSQETQHHSQLPQWQEAQPTDIMDTARKVSLTCNSIYTESTIPTHLVCDHS